MASLIYDSFLNDISTGAFVPSTATVKGILVTSTYAPNKGTHTKRSDVTNEVVGTGYTTGGVTVTVTVATNTTTHATTYTFSSPSWASSTITARGLVLYKSTGTSTTDNLLEYCDFLSDVVSTNGTFTVTISSLVIQN